MIDEFYFPSNTFGDVKMFYCAGSSGAAGNWQEWVKPRGCSLITMVCIGSGSGGGAGFTRASGAAGGGGGGGGSSGASRLIIPAFMVSDRLYIQVAIGGAGVAAGGSGNSGVGNLSYISIAPGSVAAANLYLVSGAAAATAATTGASAAAKSAICTHGSNAIRIRDIALPRRDPVVTIETAGICRAADCRGNSTTARAARHRRP